MKTSKSAAPQQKHLKAKHPASRRVYPFTEIVGQEEMKLALILNSIDPTIGGVLIMGHRGTGKSTAVRGLADLLPDIDIVRDCLYRCDPIERQNLCHDCQLSLQSKTKIATERVPVRVVDLPLGATEDRICGTIDIEDALSSGKRTFEPGLLALANRGFLYIDEVNLLEDHLVDVLLDAAATGRNRVERESISIDHPAQFVLIGSGNPEEGELRPQLQDRFGLHVEVLTDNALETRIAIVEKRERFDRSPETFCQNARAEQDRLGRRLAQARKKVSTVSLDSTLLRQIAQLCSHLSIDGHRGELTIARAARALAAFEGRSRVLPEDVKQVSVMALRHRLRRDALDESPGADQIKEALERVFQPDSIESPHGSTDDRSSGDQLKSVTSTGSRFNSGSAKAQSASSSSERGDDGVLKLSGPADLTARMTDLSTKMSKGTNGSKVSSAGRHQSNKSATKGGRYTRAVSFKTTGVALDATLRALAVDRVQSNRRRIQPHPEALRYKLFARKTGRLFIFAIDTSGSMALNRISHAKGALLQLLKKSYVERDRVAIVAFGGTRARILLSPSRSMLRARRVLDSLSVGGGTPLSAGIDCALEVAQQAAKRESEIVLLLFTDGKANVSLRDASLVDRIERKRNIDLEMQFFKTELRRIGVTTVVVETRDRFLAGTEARDLAASLGAQLFQINSRSS